MTKRSGRAYSKFFGKMALSMLSLSLLFSGAGAAPKAKAAETAFHQKGSGILGWHATPYGGSFNEAKMQANVDWLASDFKNYGYEYVCLDGWVEDSTIHNADGYITTYKTIGHKIGNGGRIMSIPKA